MKIAAVLATSFLSFSAIDARATAPADVETVTVQFADLDLDRKAGIVTLFQRIKGAAKRVCAVHEGETVVAKRTYAACLDLALSTAVARIDRPMLSDYIVQQSGKLAARAPARVAVR